MKAVAALLRALAQMDVIEGRDYLIYGLIRTAA